jgi:hypothetical protein
MDGSLQAYCATLNPLNLEHSSFRPHDARAPSSERLGENCPVVLAEDFDMSEICDMGQDGFTSPPWKACWGFFFSPWKNPTASAEFEPANLGTKMPARLPLDH